MYRLDNFYFNSHAHVERDKLRHFMTVKTKISTHTLTWSVTVIFMSFNSPLLFQLTRSRGAWPVCEQEIKGYFNFNSHAHVERDFTWDNLPDTIDISTHTLTWSVTVLHMNSFNVNIFQLTRSRGAWHFLWNADETKFHFNSHAHVERDPCDIGYIATDVDFNSHAHVERDFLCKDDTVRIADFNSHAHVERDGMGFWRSLLKIHFNSHAHVERDIRPH